MFYLFELIFPIIFLIVFGMCIFAFARGVKTWNKNNNSPRLTVPVRVVSKRSDVSHHNQAVGGDASGAHGFNTVSNTSYYITFEVESGDRIELNVQGSVYGMIAEGDKGKLTFQGTRYLDFERDQLTTGDIYNG
ncbi:MAG: DUF2500 domain-containing protein [Eubacteriales bacterium]|nr:DUF2500 domain-containing protein [Eubacteriales bacterium]